QGLADPGVELVTGEVEAGLDEGALEQVTALALDVHGVEVGGAAGLQGVEVYPSDPSHALLGEGLERLEVEDQVERPAGVGLAEVVEGDCERSRRGGRRPEAQVVLLQSRDVVVGTLLETDGGGRDIRGVGVEAQLGEELWQGVEPAAGEP